MAQKRQFILSHACFYSLALKEPKKKNFLEASTLKGLFQHHIGLLPGLQFPGWKSFPLESCKMLVMRSGWNTPVSPNTREGSCHAMLLGKCWVLYPLSDLPWKHKPGFKSVVRSVVGSAKHLSVILNQRGWWGGAESLKSQSCSWDRHCVEWKEYYTIQQQYVSSLGQTLARWLLAACLGKGSSDHVLVFQNTS